MKQFLREFLKDKTLWYKIVFYYWLYLSRIKMTVKDYFEFLKDKLKDKWWDISYFIRYQCISFFPQFFAWIARCVHYSIFLWKDGDWDHAFLLELLQFKIRRMKKATLKYGKHVEDYQKMVDSMQHVEDLITKHLNEDFSTKEEDEHEKVWGKLDLISEDTDRPGYNKVIFSRQNANTKQLKKQEEKEQRVIWKLHDKRRKQNFKELFTYLHDHLQEWWY